MTWIKWIKVEPDDSLDEEVRRLYDKTRDRVTGNPPDTVRLASLTPQVAGLLYELQRAIYHGAKGLSVREKEIVALIVSAYNGCAH
jgi:alkylhydroperoxidase family enzyme